MRLLECLSQVAKCRHLADATVECYAAWVKRYFRFHCTGGRWKHPSELSGRDLEQFLTFLAVRKHVSASTQNQALCAIVFLYKQVLVDDLGSDHLGHFQALRARRRVRVPTVLIAAEVGQLIAALPVGSMARLMVRVMYGTGLRIKECCTLRVRDVDLDRHQIIVRGGKGDKDRLVMLPGECSADLSVRIRQVRQQHARMTFAAAAGWHRFQTLSATRCLTPRTTGGGSSCSPAPSSVRRRTGERSGGIPTQATSTMRSH